MINAHANARRPFFTALTGLLLVSACSTAAESAPTPAPALPAIDLAADRSPESTPAPSTAPVAVDQPVTAAGPGTSNLPTTTRPPTTLPATTLPATTLPAATLPAATLPAATLVPAAAPTSIAAVDVAERTVFGIGIFEAVDVDAVSADVSARLGSPTTDSGWRSMAGQFDCTGSTDFRVLWWGDFRMTFERYQGDDTVRDELSAWTVGDPTLFTLAPTGDVPEPSPSDVVTIEDIGLGSTRGEIDAAWTNVNNGGDNRLVVIDRGGSLLVGLGERDQVVGFGDGSFDCPVDEPR